VFLIPQAWRAVTGLAWRAVTGLTGLTGLTGNKKLDMARVLLREFDVELGRLRILGHRKLKQTIGSTG